jgi:Epoxide hydrolase N terminus
MTKISTTPQGSRQADDKNAIRPFHVNILEADLTELRRRINATNWPEREMVTDATQGVQLATMQALARYWGTEYDWRKVEARLNALPQFITEIDRLDIHFIHVRSQHEDALPLIVTHGWPGSVIEQIKVLVVVTLLWRRMRAITESSTPMVFWGVSVLCVCRRSYGHSVALPC